MNIELAIRQLQEEVDLLAKSKPGEVDWWLRQGKSLGLSLLRTFLARKLTDPTFAAKFRNDLRRGIVQDKVPETRKLEPDPEATIPQPNLPQ